MYNALVGVRPVDISSWADFKQVCRQLRSEDAKKMYETIIVDTLAIAYSLCEKYILNRELVNSIGEIPYGKGWGMLKDEFETTFRELTQLGYAIVFISHSKTKKTEYTDEEGNVLEALAPDLPNAAYQIVNRMVDLIAYLGVEYDLKTGVARRYLYTRGTPTIFAGSRYRYLQPKIELSYDNLVHAIADAMAKEANLTGTQLINSKDVDYSLNDNTRSFEETMLEAKNLFEQILALKGEEGGAKIAQSVKKVFGKDFVLSKALPEQQDMVELVILDMKEILAP